MAYLMSYTRMPMDSKIYDNKLAYSMHLAISDDGFQFCILNHNSGVLFAKAVEKKDGSLRAKSLKNPRLFTLSDGHYGVVAIRTESDGGEDAESKGNILLFKTDNFTEYEEVGLLKLGKDYIEEAFCIYNIESETISVIWRQAEGIFMSEIKDLEELVLTKKPVKCTNMPDVSIYMNKAFDVSGIEGAVIQNVIEISGEEAEELHRRLLTPVNTGIEFPEQIMADSPQTLGTYYAKAHYSDGSIAEKRIDWDLSNVNFHQKGTYSIIGKVHRDHFEFPIAVNRADPCIGRWRGKYYFIATNDADNNHTLFIREADTIPELINAKEHLILDSKTYRGIEGLLWAPEFHEIEGRLYIFHAATSGEFYYEESHVMELREGGNPICREDWSAPKRIVKNDGSNICEAGKEITLDMTCFKWQGEYYAVWSQRRFLPEDLGAWLYIAKLDPINPWRLLTEPVVLSKPEYGWANNHTFVDEGPFALPREDRLYLTFSSAAVDATYVVGLLEIRKGKDLLDRNNWRKNNYPILTSRSVKGEFGTGHNAYVVDEYGTVWSAYHARPGVDGARCSGIRRVHFNVYGEPILDMTEELDLNEEFSTVKTELEIITN